MSNQMAESIGAMEGAFFISRTEILDWLNQLLKLELSKIEETCTGAVACQVIDAIWNGTVHLTKVNFKAKHEYEFVGNYKILQQGFLKNHVEKYIDVEKLIKGKYQDNLEFMQWLKRFYDKFCGRDPSEYDALKRRNYEEYYYLSGKGGKTAGGIKMHKLPSTGAAKPRMVSKKNMVPSGGSGATEAELEKMEKEVEEWKEKYVEMERLKDFYFEKLRNIELVIERQNEQEGKLGAECCRVLYATEDEKITVDEEGFATIQEHNME